MSSWQQAARLTRQRRNAADVLNFIRGLMKLDQFKLFREISKIALPDYNKPFSSNIVFNSSCDFQNLDLASLKYFLNSGSSLIDSIIGSPSRKTIIQYCTLSTFENTFICSTAFFWSPR